MLTTFVDANLMADITTGRSQTGIIHLLNKTPCSVHEAVAAGIITVMWVKSEDNLADICTKIMSGVTLKRILSYLLVPRRLKQIQ